jgi:DMSO/TMAO reductase YedYZ molybdopterin-dependent catalytic subunit
MNSSLKDEFNTVLKYHPEIQTVNALKMYWKTRLNEQQRTNLEMPPPEIFQTYWNLYKTQGGKRKTRNTKRSKKGTYRRRR